LLVNQKVLQRQLQNHGIQTIVANHGGEALEVLKTSSYWTGNTDPSATEISVVLMDKVRYPNVNRYSSTFTNTSQEMPIMDGLQCTSKIRALEVAGQLRRHVPIIAVTANARTEQINTLLEAGMDDVVSKPFRVNELIPKIEELAARYKDKDVEMSLNVPSGPTETPYCVA
jgi:CheY-like chemotaxis protein